MRLAIVILKIIFLVCKSVTEELHFGSSEFVCENNELKEITNGGNAMISLPANGAYNFKVNFKKTDDKTCINQQRCNLLIWKAVRDLAKYLNKNCCRNGQLELNKTMLMSGIEYIIDVRTNDKTLIKHYTLNADEKMYVNNVKPLASVSILLGTSIASAYSPFVINAEESICSTGISDYYFQWQILDQSNAPIVNFPEKNKELTIQPEILRNLQPGIKYKIVCNLINMANNVQIAMDSKEIEIQTSATNVDTNNLNTESTAQVAPNTVHTTTIQESMEPVPASEDSTTNNLDSNTTPENENPSTEIDSSSGTGNFQIDSATTITSATAGNEVITQTDSVVDATTTTEATTTEVTTNSEDSTEITSESTVNEEITTLATDVSLESSSTVTNAETTATETMATESEVGSETSASMNVAENITLTDEQLQENSNIETGHYSDKFSVLFPFQYTTIALNYPIQVKPLIFSHSYSEDSLEMEWTCIYQEKDICQGTKDRELNFEGGLQAEGNLSVIVKVSNGVKSELAACTIILIADLPSIEIEISDYPAKPFEGVKITATVSELRTFCAVLWKSEGTNPYNLSLLPGNVDRPFNITAPDDQFLSELGEFGDETINTEFVLEIPPVSERFEGLKEEFYQFSLMVTCPSLAEIISSKIELQEKPADFVVVKAGILLEVALPPTARAMRVDPQEGESLKTMFEFRTESAIGQAPILYQFGYVLRKREIIFYSIMEMTFTRTFLPYNEGGIKTFYVVCDNINSCTKIYGPIVKTVLPKVVDESQIRRYFKQKINSEEYSKAFGYAYSVLETTKYLGRDKEFMDTFSEMVDQKIKQLGNVEIKEEFWKANSNNLIKAISEFDDDLGFSTEVINDLIMLRQTLTGDLNVKHKRHLLSVEENFQNLDELKNHLGISDLVISRSTNKEEVVKEKDSVISILRKYMPKLCVDIYNRNIRTTIKVELKTVVFAVEKLNRKLNNFLTIPFENNAWNITAKIKPFIQQKNNKLCIGKTIFKNYFNNEGLQFGAVLLNGDGTEKNITQNVRATILLPVVENTEQTRCVVYDDGFEERCLFQKKKSNFIQYSCPKLGYFLLKYENSTIIDEEVDNISTITPNINKGISGVTKVPAKVYRSYATISYVVIVSSLIGLVILGYIIKKISMGPQYNVHTINMENAQYANLYNKELLR